jgi:hypothetical protein
LGSSSTASSPESANLRLRQENPRTTKRNNKINRVPVQNLRVRIEHGKQGWRWLRRCWAVLRCIFTCTRSTRVLLAFSFLSFVLLFRISRRRKLS